MASLEQVLTTKSTYIRVMGDFSAKASKRRPGNRDAERFGLRERIQTKKVLHRDHLIQGDGEETYLGSTE